MSVEGQKAQSAVVGGAASERAKRDGDMWAGLSWTSVTVTATSSEFFTLFTRYCFTLYAFTNSLRAQHNSVVSPAYV